VIVALEGDLTVPDALLVNEGEGVELGVKFIGGDDANPAASLQIAAVIGPVGHADLGDGVNEAVNARVHVPGGGDVCDLSRTLAEVPGSTTAGCPDSDEHGRGGEPQM